VIIGLDTELGRLLAEIDLEKTVVIFVGDDGTPAPVKDAGTGIRGSKGSVYEGGVRVPFIVSGAGVTRRGREDELLGHDRPLCNYSGAHRGELYDLVADSLETTNLYTSAAHAAVLASLKAEIVERRAEAPGGYFPE
jgi:hypothetical protein